MEYRNNTASFHVFSITLFASIQQLFEIGFKLNIIRLVSNFRYIVPAIRY